MRGGDSAPLAGAEIHGFQTAEDLHVEKLMEVAATRWFRPNEVHAILSNYTCFKIQPQPIDNPMSGTILLFDRKMLRNFRKDGHNWKKKKDGKTVQEAHEKLKVGNEDRIHVYYARSEDDPNFYRRCYWLLDKNLEHIVLVHYRQTSEDNSFRHLPGPGGCTETLSLTNMMHHGYPLTPMNSTSGSAHSEFSGSAVTSEEINSREDHAIYTGSGISQAENSTELRHHELCLHEINTLDWADLLEPTSSDSVICREGDASSPNQQMPDGFKNFVNNDRFLPSHGVIKAVPSSGHPTDVINCNEVAGVNHMNCLHFQAAKDLENQSSLFKTMDTTSQVADFKLDAVHSCASPDILTGDVFFAQNSFGRWNCMNDNSLGSLDDQLELGSSGDKSNAFTIVNQSSTPEQVFTIIDISPGWAYSTEETKVLVVGHFSEPYKHLMASNIYCVFGEMHASAEMIQGGVYRCSAKPHPPGLVNFFMTLDGYTPISQLLSFDYRSMPSVQLNGGVASSEDDNNKLKWKEFQVQTKLAHLLFSPTNNISIQSNKMQSKSLNEAKRYASVTSPLLENDWIDLLVSNNMETSHVPATRDLVELVLKNKFQEWLLEKVAEGCKTTAHDSQGQGAIHLCAILDYAWAVHFFSLTGMSLDFRDASGWTALHWAAYFGRENMVAALLSAGANPSLVTDPTPESPGGCTAADLASKQGYEGLAAYLAEKGLTTHIQAMYRSGNITAPMPRGSTNQENSENVYPENLTEQELCLKESLAAYRNAADAAGRIQAAFRERTLKQQMKAVQLVKPEIEAAQIVAALKIQHAFRNYSRQRMMKAAARIQSHFRTSKFRRNFLNMRKQTIKIQAAFRGHQVRRQYCKILWSVGVLEKAILRWRLKRKGLRGIQVEPKQAMKVDTEEESTAEEDFFKISREQAEERMRRSVIWVQTMFRSYRAQQEYRRMKLAHEQAKLEFRELGQRP